MADFTVEHNQESSQFEVRIGEQTAFLLYFSQPGRIILDHTEVPPSLEGRGIGSALARAGLDYARQNSLRVTATCSFVQSYLQRHPEYQDLVE